MATLDCLLSDDLMIPALPMNSAAAFREYFRRSREIADVRQAILDGTISDASVHRFVTSLMRDLEKGILFRHDRTIAALAVALESMPEPWVDTFLKELSALKIAEMPLAPRVAIEVVKQRPACPSTFVKSIGAMEPVTADQP